MRDPYAIYFAAFLGGMMLMIVGIAGPLTSSQFLRNLWVRLSILAIALACYFVMRKSLAALRPDRHEALYLTATSGGFALMLVLDAMATAFGIARYLCTPLDVAADEKDLEESRRHQSDADREYSDWDRQYQRRRPDG